MAAWFCLGASIGIEALRKLIYLKYLLIYFAAQRSLDQGVRDPNYSLGSEFSCSSLDSPSLGFT